MTEAEYENQMNRMLFEREHQIDQELAQMDHNGLRALYDRSVRRLRVLERVESLWREDLGLHPMGCVCSRCLILAEVQGAINDV